MVYLSYMFSELRRRKGRTLLTSLGLGVGIALVITVSALTAGLDSAQAKVLQPLTGVGTDMTVSRPIEVSNEGSSGAGPFATLSDDERSRLEEENGAASFDLQELGEPGTSFSRDSFIATSQLSFPESEVANVSSESGVQSAAGGLTLNSIHLEGTVPEESEQSQGGFGGGFAGLGSVDTSSVSISGVDQSNKELGAITPGQVTSGSYLTAGDKREAILNESYASREGLGVGDDVEVGGKQFTVVGIAETPLGGQSSDVYVKLSQLQELSGRDSRVNTVYLRAHSSDQVASVAQAITSSFSGSSVTSAEDLAERVSGSLVDAKNLASKLGIALQMVGLLAAVLIASLLTLSSVTKRIRELGTLKAIGWSQRLVVRQVSGESLLQGLLGAAFGVVLGVAGAALIAAFAPTLTASVTETAPQFGPFGQGAVSSGATAVALTAPVSLGLVALAVVLALAGGLVSGAVGGLHAARLRPADALRHAG